MKTALAIRHVHFEGLGLLEGVLERAGWQVRYVEAAAGGLDRLDPLAPELLVVLGGPIGAYEEALYPFVNDELALLETRLRAARATLGICLGAQLMARALGARVYPAGGKEIGWAPLTLTDAGRVSPLGVLSADTPVLHWHGDTFDLPDGATRLASTALCPNQAFSWGRHALGLQFHLEVTAADLEYWLIGHACEIAGQGPQLTVSGLRADTKKFAPALQPLAVESFSRWVGNATS